MILKIFAKISRLLLFLLVALTGCVDEVNLRTAWSEPKIVIDGWISNDLHMSYVNVYYAAPFYSSTNVDYKAPNVDRVFVEAEQQDMTVDYVYMGQRPYLPLIYFQPRQKFEFEIGERFRLNVILKDGNHYQSDWQEVYPQAKILDFEYEISERTVFVERANGAPFQQRNHYLKLQAHLEKLRQNDGHHYYIKTSGYEELATVGLLDNCDCMCFKEINNVTGTLNALSNPEAGRPNMLQEVASISLARATRFYVNVDVYALSPSTGAFLEKISDQQKNTGSIFDPAPSKITGNMKNLHNEDEEVLGSFFTANHSRKDMIVRRADFLSKYRHLNIRRDALPIVDSLCVDYYTEASRTIPLPLRNN